MFLVNALQALHRDIIVGSINFVVRESSIGASYVKVPPNFHYQDSNFPEQEVVYCAQGIAA